MNWKDIWVEKYRPKTLDEIVLSPELRKFLESLKDGSDDECGIPNLLFSGPAGCGKTSLAKIIATDLMQCQHIYINASEETSIEVVRTKIMGFAQTRSIDGMMKIIILDEAEGLSGSTASGRSSAQQALRNVIEEYSENTRFIFTSNYPEKIIEALHSRLLHFPFTLTEKDCLKQSLKVLKSEDITIPKEQVDNFKNLVKTLTPDLRNILIQLQKSSNSGVLEITNVEDHSRFLSKYVIEALIEKKDLLKLREFLIKNEDKYNINFHELLREMFNAILTENPAIGEKNRMQAALIISDSIVDHSVVSDKEINFSACVFKLSQVL